MEGAGIGADVVIIAYFDSIISVSYTHLPCRQVLELSIQIILTEINTIRTLSTSFQQWVRIESCTTYALSLIHISSTMF